MKRRTRRLMIRLGILFAVLIIVSFFLLQGCALLTPLPAKSTVSDRLADFPTEDLPIKAPVTVYWDRHMIPFIEAQSDEDLAFVLGMVHAHLRLGQMELLKRVALGRLAELFGPSVVKIDHSLRILGPGRAAAEIYRNMPPDTRTWLAEFVRGVNFYQDGAADLPHEFKVGSFDKERWTPEQVIAMGRLGSVDVNWLTWFALLPIRGKPYFGEVLKKLLDTGASSLPSFTPSARGLSLSWLLAGLSRSGSNSFAVSAARSKTGGAILASDPHLGITIPSTWLVVGCKSPSYHSVGMMMPGIPATVIGRSRHIAWGGTNMRAASSDLYDVSGEPPESTKSRQEKIRVRWWFDREVTVRESRLGPVVSDIPVLSGYDGPELALRWVGHEATDELTAILRASRARNWREFLDAFRTYGVAGMNIQYADAKGNIGQLMAVRLPVRRTKRPEDIVLDPGNPNHLWQGYRSAPELPFAYNPKQGFLVSCNNVPAKADFPIGYFYISNDRLLRITELLSKAAPLSLDDVMQIQKDVYSISDVALRDAILRKIDACGLGTTLAERHPDLFPDFSTWDGQYTTDSAGAVAFQAILYHLALHRYSTQHKDAEVSMFFRATYAGDFLNQDLQSTADDEWKDALPQVFSAAAKSVEQHGSWGEMHRLRIAHPFSNIPLVGSRYVFGDYPGRGSNDTVHKSAHGLSAEKSSTRYGSNARYISDLSRPDENYFVLLGGQDGWLNSDASLDQVSLWRSHQYIKVPLLVPTVRKAFEFRLDLKPGESGN